MCIPGLFKQPKVSLPPIPEPPKPPPPLPEVAVQEASPLKTIGERRLGKRVFKRKGDSIGVPNGGPAAGTGGVGLPTIGGG